MQFEHHDCASTYWPNTFGKAAFSRTKRGWGDRFGFAQDRLLAAQNAGMLDGRQLFATTPPFTSPTQITWQPGEFPVVSHKPPRSRCEPWAATGQIVFLADWVQRKVLLRRSGEAGRRARNLHNR